MVRRLNVLISGLLVLAIVLYVITLNRDPVTIRLSPGSDLTLETGVEMILLFCLGVVAASIVGTLLSFRTYIRERRLIRRDREREEFLDTLVKARGYSAADDIRKARLLWDQIMKKDPKNIPARVELARLYEVQGSTNEALRTLDGARAIDGTNIEVLFEAAEVHLQQGNKTAAVDNLALVLATYPNVKAARMARDLSEDLGRIEDALEYQAVLESLGQYDDERSGRLKFQKLLADSNGQDADLPDRLKNFVRANPSCTPAIRKLGELLAGNGEFEEAANVLMQGARTTKAEDLWRDVVRIWAARRQPKQALSAARAAAREVVGLARLEAEIHLIKLYLYFEMNDEAFEAIERFTEVAEQERVTISDSMEESLLVLRGICLSHLGKSAEAAEVWSRVTSRSLMLASEPRVTTEFEEPLLLPH